MHFLGDYKLVVIQSPMTYLSHKQYIWIELHLKPFILQVFRLLAFIISLESLATLVNLRPARTWATLTHIPLTSQMLILTIPTRLATTGLCPALVMEVTLSQRLLMLSKQWRFTRKH